MLDLFEEELKTMYLQKTSFLEASSLESIHAILLTQIPLQRFSEMGSAK